MLTTGLQQWLQRRIELWKPRPEHRVVYVVVPSVGDMADAARQAFTDLLSRGFAPVLPAWVPGLCPAESHEAFQHGLDMLVKADVVGQAGLLLRGRSGCRPGTEAARTMRSLPMYVPTIIRMLTLGGPMPARIRLPILPASVVVTPPDNPKNEELRDESNEEKRHPGT